MFLRRRLSALVLAVGVLVAPHAQATSIDITYAINVDFNALQFGSPIFVGTGVLTVRFNGTPDLHAITGPVQIVSGSVDLSAVLDFGQNAVVTGHKRGLITGSLFPGTANQFANLLIRADGSVTSGSIHCTGIACTYFDLPTASQPQALTGEPFLFSLYTNLQGFPSVGPQAFSGYGPGGHFGNLVMRAEITGVEISRTLVPEPSFVTAISAGALVLLALRAARSRSLSAGLAVRSTAPRGSGRTR